MIRFCFGLLFHVAAVAAIRVNLSPAQITEILDLHNELRRGRDSSNMEELKWNNELAEMGQEWAERCYWGHGQPPRSNEPFENIGQNLFRSSDERSMTEVVMAWYDEIADYDYNSNTCRGACGHYTQVVWAKTREVGCGYHNCPGYPGHYVVCNYGPAGNFNNEKPYLVGAPCTQCTSGSQWCDQDLCKADCTREGPSCECRALCQNCGSVDVATCSCQCESGWTGGDCSAVCQDTHSYCNNGWYEQWCDQEHSYVLEGCPAMCSLCTENPNRRPCRTLTPSTCGEWSAWDTRSCRDCGGCGVQTRQRTCGDDVEREDADCSPKYCLRGINSVREYLYKRSPFTGIKRRIGRKRRCCYDYRTLPYLRLKREKYCSGRRVRGWKDPTFS